MIKQIFAVLLIDKWKNTCEEIENAGWNFDPHCTEKAFWSFNNYASNCIAFSDQLVKIEQQQKFAKIGLSTTRRGGLNPDFCFATRIFNHTCLSGKAPPGHDYFQAQIVFDHFHIAKLLNEELSNLRRVLYNQKAELNKKQLLKGTRWLLLKNKDNLYDKLEESRRVEETLAIN